MGSIPLWHIYFRDDELKNDPDIALAPLTPQFWGEMTLVFGYLPPELGGRGGECKDE
jgi:hypothetical protein